MAGFESSIRDLVAKIPHQIQLAQTEEATKVSCINPFIRALGYDTEDLREVVPEYTADIRGGKGEKVDYAIMRDGQPAMLFECKAANTNLSDAHRGQLKSYFTAEKATRIGVLTNGVVYEFFTDLDANNVMDNAPFWVVDLSEDMGDDTINTLRQFTKDDFNSRYDTGKC